MRGRLAWFFGRRSFIPIWDHAQAVEQAAEELDRELRAWLRGEAVNAEAVSQAEHRADLIKRDLRVHLRQAIWLPIPKSYLLELIWHQDEIADLCQDGALLMKLRRPKLAIELEDGFAALGEAIVRAIHAYQLTVEELDEAIRAGLRREQRAKIVEGVERINKLEHESDLLERELVANIYQAEGLSDFDRYHLVQVVVLLGNIVDQTENAAGDIRVIVAGT